MVTWVIIGLCLVAFLGQQLLGDVFEQWLIFAPVIGLHHPWTFVTSAFLHGGFIHIALNMWCLYAVGPAIERAIGHGRFLTLFLLSAVAGHTSVLLLASPSAQSWYTGTVGASGGVFGLFAAVFILQRRGGGDARQAGVLIAINLVLSFTMANVSWQGHLGGLLIGAAYTAALFRWRGTKREHITRRHVLVTAGFVVLLLALIAAKYRLV